MTGLGIWGSTLIVLIWLNYKGLPELIRALTAYLWYNMPVIL